MAKLQQWNVVDLIAGDHRRHQLHRAGNDPDLRPAPPAAFDQTQEVVRPGVGEREEDRVNPGPLEDDRQLIDPGQHRRPTDVIAGVERVGQDAH